MGVNEYLKSKDKIFLRFLFFGWTVLEDSKPYEKVDMVNMNNIDSYYILKQLYNFQMIIVLIFYLHKFLGIFFSTC